MVSTCRHRRGGEENYGSSERTSHFTQRIIIEHPNLIPPHPSMVGRHSSSAAGIKEARKDFTINAVSVAKGRLRRSSMQALPTSATGHFHPWLMRLLSERSCPASKGPRKMSASLRHGSPVQRLSEKLESGHS